MEAGANPDCLNESGNTPLHSVIYLGILPYQKNILLSAELLAGSMENPDVKNTAGLTALELINNLLYFYREENRQFKNNFKTAIEKPRAFHSIETPITERSKGSFTLSDNDKADIVLYDQGVVPPPRVLDYEKHNDGMHKGKVYDSSYIKSFNLTLFKPHPVTVEIPVEMLDREEKSSSSYSMD